MSMLKNYLLLAMVCSALTTDASDKSNRSRPQGGGKPKRARIAGAGNASPYVLSAAAQLLQTPVSSPQSPQSPAMLRSTSLASPPQRSTARRVAPEDPISKLEQQQFTAQLALSKLEKRMEKMHEANLFAAHLLGAFGAILQKANNKDFSSILAHHKLDATSAETLKRMLEGLNQDQTIDPFSLREDTSFDLKDCTGATGESEPFDFSQLADQSEGHTASGDEGDELDIEASVLSLSSTSKAPFFSQPSANEVTIIDDLDVLALIDEHDKKAAKSNEKSELSLSCSSAEANTSVALPAAAAAQQQQQPQPTNPNSSSPAIAASPARPAAAAASATTPAPEIAVAQPQKAPSTASTSTPAPAPATTPVAVVTEKPTEDAVPTQTPEKTVEVVVQPQQETIASDTKSSAASPAASATAAKPKPNDGEASTTPASPSAQATAENGSVKRNDGTSLKSKSAKRRARKKQKEEEEEEETV